MTFQDSKGKPRVEDALLIPEVVLLQELTGTYDLMLSTCEFLFKGKLIMPNPPFKGFILEGPPGTGKTEIVKQVARKLDARFPSVKYSLIDGASIAAPKWGEGERNLRYAFHSIDEIRNQQPDAKMVVLFDDIESLMITRGADTAKEWHYAINSILFHELDALDPTRILVCATTNRPDLVDEAIRTRLYPIQVPPLNPSRLRPVVLEILMASGLEDEALETTTNTIMNRIEETKTGTIREARFITVATCIEEGIWIP